MFIEKSKNQIANKNSYKCNTRVQTPAIVWNLKMIFQTQSFYDSLEKFTFEYFI